jgi:hypothetical protein
MGFQRTLTRRLRIFACNNMANKRMFSKEVIGSDMFLDLPVSSRELYFQLGMYADDDGFVSPKKVIRMVGASDDDIKVLASKGFVIPFKSGVLVITHWKENNYIQIDRYHETIHQEEFKQLGWIQGVYNMDTQIRLDKIRLDKKRVDPPKKEYFRGMLIVKQNDGEFLIPADGSKPWPVFNRKEANKDEIEIK